MQEILVHDDGDVVDDGDSDNTSGIDKITSWRLMVVVMMTNNCVSDDCDNIEL